MAEQQQQEPKNPVTDPARFREVLEKLMSPNNQERELAEKYYKDTLSVTPGVCFGWMLEVLAANTDQNTVPLRQLVAVLLRKELVSKSNLESLQPASVAQIKAALITCLKGEELMVVKKKIADSIATFAVQDYDSDGEWPELLTNLYEFVNNGDNKLKECAFTIFCELSYVMVRSPKLQPYFQPLLQVFSTALENAAPDFAKVRVAALKAATMFLIAIDKPKTRKQFQPILPLMLQALNHNLNADPNSNESRNAVDHLIDLILEDAGFFKPHFELYSNAMIQIAQASTLDHGIRSLAMEFLLCAAETSPAMCRKANGFINQSVQVSMQMMLEIEDIENFNAVDEDEEDDESVYDVGREAIDRLGIALGGKHVVPVAFSQLSGYLSAQEWKGRHAALMVMSQLGEVLEKSKLGQVVETVLNYFRDPHPRVRYAAIHCIGQLCTDFNPKLQKEHHQTVLPALCAAMDDAANPRVQSHAACAIINFADDCPHEILQPYLSGLLEKLVALLMTNNLLVQEQAITAMASIADSAGEAFIQFYDQIVPLLMQILSTPPSKEMRSLKGRAMECVTQVGLVVGKEKFGPDALKIVQIFHHIQSSPMEDDDPQKGYILQAWARICRCLEKDFLPYLPTVMPPLMEAVKHMPQVDIVDADDDKPEEGVDSIPLGNDKKLRIRTSGLDDKLTACKMLRCYITTLKEGVVPLLNEVTEAIIPLLKFVYMEDIRIVAAETIPTLIEAAKVGVEAHVTDRSALVQVFLYLYAALLQAIKDEPDIEVLESFLECVTECFQLMQLPSNRESGRILTAEIMKESLVTMVHQIMASMDRMQTIEERREEEDMDDEEEEQISDELEREGSILIAIQSWFGEVIEMMGETLWGMLHEQIQDEEGQLPATTFMNEVTKLLQPQRPAEQRRTGMCLLDQIVEHAGAPALGLYDSVVPAILQESVPTNDDQLRQAAVYGLGACAEVGGETFARFVPKVLEALYAVVNDPQARPPRTEEDDDPSSRAMATDNAISAIGKIILHQRQFPAACVDVNTILPLWLRYLPVRDDEEEAVVVHGQLATFLESSILPVTEASIPEVVRVFSAVYDSNLSDTPLNGRIVAIFKGLQAQHNDAFMRAAGSLPQEQQANLQKALSA